MIIEMTRIRVLGPRAQLAAAIRVLQDVGLVHLVDATIAGGFTRSGPGVIERRRRRHLVRALSDVDATIEGLARFGARIGDASAASPTEGRAALLAARLAARTAALRVRELALVEERDALRMYAPFADLAELFMGKSQHRVSITLLLLRDAAALESLRAALARVIGPGFDLRSHVAASGEMVVLLVVPAARGEEIDRLLAEAHVERAPLPAALRGRSLAEAIGGMRPRLAEIEAELLALTREAAAIARDHGADLASARRVFHDALTALDAAELAVASTRVFALEGWLPARERESLAAALASGLGANVVVEEIAHDAWAHDEAPVVLANPRWFAPFEALTSLLPLPRYGSVDPTPFVAVFFPMMFGIIVGDVGYGAAMLALAAVLWRLGKQRTWAHGAARIAGAVSVFAIAFGFAYGELFGDIGRNAFGMHALWFDREEAVLAFLTLAVTLGVVHLLLGLVVATVNRWRDHRREALGRGLTAVMLVLVVVALLVAFERLPSQLLTPALVALLVAFPILLILEGASALLELVSILGHVLSYARVMALGTASVMLAVVANQMVGAFGSVAIGVAFALLFHLVNFAITLFSPTIHVMRLHYVEFFDTFFEPGGGAYRPLRHWSPGAT